MCAIDICFSVHNITSGHNKNHHDCIHPDIYSLFFLLKQMIWKNGTQVCDNESFTSSNHLLLTAPRSGLVGEEGCTFTVDSSLCWYSEGKSQDLRQNSGIKGLYCAVFCMNNSNTLFLRCWVNAHNHRWVYSVQTPAYTQIYTCVCCVLLPHSPGSGSWRQKYWWKLPLLMRHKLRVQNCRKTFKCKTR